MRKILLVAGLAVLVSGCGEKAILRKRSTRNYHNQSCATPCRTTTLYSIKVFRLRLTVATILPDTVLVMKSLRDLLNKGCSLFHNRQMALAVLMFWKSRTRAKRLSFGTVRKVPVLVIGKLLR